MPVFVLIALLAAAPEESLIPGKIVATADLGSTLNRQPKLRVGAGAIWLPFPEQAWRGLSEVGARAELIFVPVKNGTAALTLWVGYGRPTPRFWLGFDAGVGTALGWHTHEGGTPYLQASPLAALRLGYGPVGLRLVAFVTNQAGALHNGYYSLCIEGLLDL